MWVLLSRWFRRMLFFSVVVPLIGWVLGKIADLLERRRGETGVSRSLRKLREYTDQDRGRRRL